jgi:hypothetical protein
MNHLVRIKEGECSGTKSNPLSSPNKSCNASVLGANYMDANIIIVALIKVMLSRGHTILTSRELM